MEQERAYKLLAEARLSSLESRIHPHFLFNTLNSIASLIPKDPKRAEHMVTRLASLLRFSLHTNHTSLVPLSQEMKIVGDYLEIEKARFGDRLRYTLDAPESLAGAAVPPLAIECLVENSIKHVAALRPEGVEIRVTAAAHDGNIRLQVWDDGPGFSLETIPSGHGLQNLRDRVKLLFPEHASLEVERGPNHSAVWVSFPRVPAVAEEERG